MVRARQPHFVSLPPGNAAGRRRGRALLSYLALPTRYRAKSRHLRGHPNSWESWAFAEVLRESGFAVDAVDFAVPHAGLVKGQYDLAIGIGGGIADVLPAVHTGLVHLHLTGSHYAFQNRREAERCAEVSARTGRLVRPHRLVSDGEACDRLADVASRLTVIGNDVTRGTFPDRFRDRLEPVPVALAAPLPEVGEIRPRAARAQDTGVLCVSGAGSVLKGVDLAIEAARAFPDVTFHFLGDLEGEKDFWAAYGQDILATANIEYHGFVPFGTRDFIKTAGQCQFLLAPSASEGMSSAVVSAWAFGLFPVISRNTGVDIADGLGLYIPDLTVSAVVESLGFALDIPSEPLRVARIEGSAFARERFSRDRRIQQIRSEFLEWVGDA